MNGPGPGTGTTSRATSSGVAVTAAVTTAAPREEDPMVVVMAPEATQADVDGIVEVVRDAGGEAFVTRGVSRTIVGLVGDVDQA